MFVLRFIKKILRVLFNMELLIKPQSYSYLSEVSQKKIRLYTLEKIFIKIICRKNVNISFIFKNFLTLWIVYNVYCKLINLGYFYLAQKYLSKISGETKLSHIGIDNISKYKKSGQDSINIFEKILYSRYEKKSMKMISLLIDKNNSDKDIINQDIWNILNQKTICLIGPLDKDIIDTKKYDIYIFFNNYLNNKINLQKELTDKIKIVFLNGKFSLRKDSINNEKIYDYLFLKNDIYNKKSNEFFLDFSNNFFTNYNSLNMIPITLFYLLIYRPSKISVFNFDLRLSRYKMIKYGDLNQIKQYDSIPTFGHNPACNFLFLSKLLSLDQFIIEIKNPIIKKLLTNNELSQYLIKLQICYRKIKNNKKSSDFV